LLTPVTPPTQETEIRKLEVQSQPRQVVPKTLSRKIPSQKIGWLSGHKKTKLSHHMVECQSWVQTPVTPKKSSPCFKTILSEKTNKKNLLFLISDFKPLVLPINIRKA
jgi:hypothetical protein